MPSSQISNKELISELKTEIKNDNVSNGAAALAYYFFLAIFPAAIFLLTLVPYLPIPNLYRAIMDLLYQSLPGDAANMFSGVVREVTSNKKGGLLSLGVILSFWAASNGMYALMQQLNITYKVKESRSFFKVRGRALWLTFLFGFFILGSLSLAIFGGMIQNWIASKIGMSQLVNFTFSVIRWLLIAGGLLIGFATIFYLGPNVRQKFRWISPGSVVAVILLGIAAAGFKFYVTHFGKYNATYGSIGAVIILMLALYITGLVILVGSEVNVLAERHQGLPAKKAA